MLVVRLREAMKDYRLRTGRHMTFAELARRLGVSESGLRVIGKRGHKTTLYTLEKIAKVLEMPAKDLLEEVPDEEGGQSSGTGRTGQHKGRKRPRKKAAKKKSGKRPAASREQGSQ
jgi:DNA-binding Xre family transcriptional regulator